VAIFALSDIRGTVAIEMLPSSGLNFAHEPAETLALAPSESSASMAALPLLLANLHTLALRARQAQYRPTIPIAVAAKPMAISLIMGLTLKVAQPLKFTSIVNWAQPRRCLLALESGVIIRWAAVIPRPYRGK
jgi:hypothetical protein